MKDGRTNNTEAGKARKKMAEDRDLFFGNILKEMVAKDIPISVPSLFRYCTTWINEKIELDRISRNAKNESQVLKSTLKKNLIKQDSFRQNKKYMNTLKHYKDQQSRKRSAQEYDTSNEKFEGMDIMEMASLLHDSIEENRALKDIMHKYEEKIQHFGKIIGVRMDTQAIIPSENEEELRKLKVSHLAALEIVGYLHDEGAIVIKNGYTHITIDILNSKEILPSELFEEIFKEAMEKNDK